MARMSLAEATARGRVDAAKIDALTEGDVARFNVADGFDSNDTLKGLRRVHTPAEIRAKAGLTQAEMAARLTVPLKTWRNWEQGRVALEPTVLAFLALVADDHERAFQVLDGGMPAPNPQPDMDALQQEFAETEVEIKTAVTRVDPKLIGQRESPRKAG